MSQPTHTTAELRALDHAHYLHPFTDHKDLGSRGARIIERAEGVYLWDSDGQKILDGMAGLWCVNIGYGRRELADAAYKQMLELPYYNSFFQCANPPAVKLAAAIAEIAPAHMNHVFFTGSGSESNDTVLRMVRRYWDLKGKPTKKTVIGRINGYHGSTVAGASLGGMAPMHEQGDLPIPGIVHIAQPYWYGEGGDMGEDEFGLWAARQLEAKIQEVGEDNVAAFIAEPIQGAGGVIIPPATYWPEIKRILDKYQILLVVDEVICGFGRLGKWFGADYFGTRPDLMAFAKGVTSGYLPLGVGGRPQTLVERAVFAVDRNQLGAGRRTQRLHDRAGRDQTLLVRQREPFARPQRLDRDGQAGETDHTVDHDIGGFDEGTEFGDHLDRTAGERG